MTYYYGFLFSIIMNSAIGCLSLLLSISIIRSQQDLKMRSILCTMQYQRLILGQEEHSII